MTDQRQCATTAGSEIQRPQVAVKHKVANTSDARESAAKALAFKTAEPRVANSPLVRERPRPASCHVLRLVDPPPSAS